MARFVVPADLYGRFRRDLNAHAEGAGFFLADYETDAGAFRFWDLRVVPESGFESRSEFHLVLRDEVKAEIIKWASDMDASLVAGRQPTITDSSVRTGGRPAWEQAARARGHGRRHEPPARHRAER